MAKEKMEVSEMGDVVEKSVKSGKGKIRGDELVLTGKGFNEEDVIKGLRDGVEYDFDLEDFPEVGIEVLEEMDAKTRVRYEKAKAEVKEREFQKSGKFRQKKVGAFDAFGILGNSELSQLKKKDVWTKPGYHSCWFRKDEAAEMIDQGYVRVKDANGNTLKAGTTGDGEAELIALQIPEEIWYESVPMEMRRRSLKYFQGATEGFQETAERLSSQFGERVDTFVEDRADDDGDDSW